ncbi:MAG: acyl-CoA dehydrogenase [Cytophagales bacterium]|nr:acyl-CoA dehydrogenase [Cytophagales bacterium]
MKIELLPQQREDQEVFRTFVKEKVIQCASKYDQEERVSLALIKELAQRGYLGAVLPKEDDGLGKDMITWGLLNEEIGRGYASLLSLLTVHGMVSLAILKWGSKEQKELWIPRMSAGEKIGAFALTEPDVGSDAKSVETSATISGNNYILNGNKKWISFGQIADIFLIMGHIEGRACAFLVEKNSPGFSIKPIQGMLGLRGSMMAELHMEQCLIPKENIIGNIGFGISHVAASALDFGRYTIAWGCVGLGQACLEACLEYTSERKQFGKYLKEHQLIQQKITDMITNVKAARLLCYNAGYLKDERNQRAMMETLIAKYFASTMATKVSSDAVQIHGANGCSSNYPLERYMRDAKMMEIIEGSTQIQQISIAKYGYRSSFR